MKATTTADGRAVEAGLRVRLVKAHHAMNAGLKGLLGQEGTVCAPCEPDAIKVRVRFGEHGMPWWVAPRYLETV